MDRPLSQARATLLALVTPALLLVIWGLVSSARLFPPSLFPHPWDVARGIWFELTSGRLVTDAIASLFRVSAGFLLAVVLGVPAGLQLGHSTRARAAFLPLVNFFRSLSPLAWIPFAILWLGIGDPPAIFLIFMAAFFPIVLSTTAAVANIPSVFFRVARDLGIRGPRLLSAVTLPAIAPQVITTLRVAAGLSWLVVVAAEMIALRSGLGYMIMDSRNAGNRYDLVVAGMIIIGLIGLSLDTTMRILEGTKWARWRYAH
jgi:NitT/TauT family transport system permease protein